MCFIPTVVVVAQYFTKRRSLATGVTMSGSGIGTFLFAPIIGVLLDNYSWRGTYAILGAVAWNCAACAILYRPIASRRHGDDVRSAEVGATSNDVGDTLHQETESKPQTLAIRCSRFLKKRSILLKNKAYIVFSGSLFVSSFGGMVVFAFLPDLAVHAGISIKDATFLVAAVGIASTVSRIALSWLSDRPFVNKPAAYASSVVVMGVSVTLCPLCSERYEALVCNMVLYGTCYGKQSVGYAQIGHHPELLKEPYLPPIFVRSVPYRSENEGTLYSVIPEFLCPLPLLAWSFLSSVLVTY